MFYNNPPGSCDTPIAAYIFFGTAIIVWKAINTIGHVHLYYLRQRSLKDKPKQKRRRVPLTPLLSFAMLLVYLVLFPLTTQNIANSKNGWAAFMFGLGWLAFGLLSFVFMLKFVHLGYLIIPSKARALAKKNAVEIDRLDFRGKVSMGLALCALICQVIVMCIVAVVVPNDYSILRIAFGFHAWFTIQQGTSMVIHFERVKKAIRAAQGGPVPTKDLGVVLRKLTEQEVVIASANAIASAFYIGLCAQAYETRWFVFTIVMWLENLNFFLILLSNYKAKKKSTSHSAVSSNGNVATGKFHEKKKLAEDVRIGSFAPVEADEKNQSNKEDPLISESSFGGNRMQSDYTNLEQPVAAYMEAELDPKV